MEASLEELEHPAWKTGIATLVGYGIILLAMFVALFIIPYLLW
jgi:hypothetical protein